ncbi:MAG: WYL domain-containing protein [Mariniphaga sp.]|nr:WYL domain-containing protein [Mariniphaga sp.]
MSKRVFFKRYLWLFEVIKNNKFITFSEIADKFNNSGLWEDEEAGFSKRTFHRDQMEILELFGMEIKYNSSRKGYFIESEYLSPNIGLLIDSYRFINTYKAFKDVDRFICAEPRKSGSEHLMMMLDAIQNRKRVEFTYRKYVDEKLEHRTIEPYFVKEFKNRWYVIARDKKDLKVKIFALERIEKDPIPASPSASFDHPQNITPENFFKDSFGIFKLAVEKPEEIELSFKPLKGRFIKSQPLHASQTIINESATELRIRLRLQITHDFIMELLSHGNELEVIKPKSLKDRLINELTLTLENYIS